ncbi:hypothetical protein GF378_02075 [Candidatus Pacearchaeota archaeon]|nr:hypothetical protein [Candidatus Pacearchaeota archaeon]
MVFENIRKKLAQKIITEQDIVNSDSYKKFIDSYQEIHKNLRGFLKRFRDFSLPKNQEDIDFLHEGEKLMEEVNQLEKLILDKDNIIMHEKSRVKKLKKELKQLQKESKTQLSQEILYLAMLYVHDPIIALDNELKILDFTQEASEYFEENIQRNIMYQKLFQEAKEFSEFKEKTKSLVPKDSLKMKIHFKERDYLNTITEPAYNEEGQYCKGYITKIETEGKLKALLGYLGDIKKRISPNKENKKIIEKEFEKGPEFA